jgi:hypothetical protein
MKYESLKPYMGPKTVCDNCHRKFVPGEAISQTSEGLVFCYSDGEGGCVLAYVFATGQILFGTPAKFRKETLPPEKRTPNYPHSPIVESSSTKTETSVPRQSLLTRIGKLFF